MKLNYEEALEYFKIKEKQPHYQTLRPIKILADSYSRKNGRKIIFEYKKKIYSIYEFRAGNPAGIWTVGKDAIELHNNFDYEIKLLSIKEAFYWKLKGD
jgi:hypothetical protein